MNGGGKLMHKFLSSSSPCDKDDMIELIIVLFLMLLLIHSLDKKSGQ